MKSLERDERYLRRIFERALLVAAAASAGGAAAFLGGSCEQGDTENTTSSSGSGSTGSGDPDAGDAGHDADPCDPFEIPPPADDMCGSYSRFPCGLPSGLTLGVGPGCYIQPNDCNRICFALPFNCHVVDSQCDDAGTIVPDDAGVVDVDCITCPGAVGRVPAGIAKARIVKSTPLGDYFAKMAHLEAASVVAFERLASELAQHGAPADLVSEARRAARDEIAHARAASRMARRFGGNAPRPRVANLPLRDLETIAVENATEGCVRETFGALVAHHQAASATDPAIATMMHRIAKDETRHAALSRTVARFLRSRLSSDARLRLEQARRRSSSALAEIDSIEASVSRGPSAALAGIPDRATRAVLAAELSRRLFESEGRAALRNST